MTEPTLADLFARADCIEASTEALGSHFEGILEEFDASLAACKTDLERAESGLL